MGARGRDTVASVRPGHAARTRGAERHLRFVDRHTDVLACGRECLARFRVLDEVIFVDHRPRTSTGTTRTHLLRQGEDQHDRR